MSVLGAERVAAVDPSAPFAEACRRRLPGVRVDVASAEALPFADAELDQALAQLVLNFMTDPRAGLREMQRVARRGGTVAGVVVAAAYDGFEDLWQPLEQGVAPSGAYVVSLAPERRLALKEEVRRRLDAGDDPFRLTARAWVATGRVG